MDFNREVLTGAVKVPAHDMRATYEGKSDASGVTHTVIFSIQGDPPPVPLIFSILAAEAWYHLRSALDYLVYQLILWKTKQPPTFNSAFPIVGRGKMTKSGWRTAIEEYEAKTSRLKQDVTSTAAALIQNMQPLRRGSTYQDDPLWILNELNNTDKHRIILLAVHAISSYTVTVTSRGKSAHAACGLRSGSRQRISGRVRVTRMRSFEQGRKITLSGMQSAGSARFRMESDGTA